MGKNVSKILIAFLLIVVVYSCQKLEKNETSIKQDLSVRAVENFNGNNLIPDSINDNSIFIKKNGTGFTRIWAHPNKDSRKKYFYSDSALVFYIGKYHFEKEALKLQQKVALKKMEWTSFTIDSTAIQEKKFGGHNYLFLSTSPNFMGTAIPERMVEFWLLNLDDISDHRNLIYAGYPNEMCDGCLKGKFAVESRPYKNKVLWNDFFQYARKSKLVYQATEKDNFNYYYKNFAEKWESDNSTDNHYGNGYGIIPQPLYSTYYKENLFKLSTSDFKEKIENKNFIVGTYLRGNILGYDKIKARYFPILIESCADFCHKKLQFISPAILQITYEDDASFEIDLSKIIFDK